MAIGSTGTGGGGLGQGKGLACDGQGPGARCTGVRGNCIARRLGWEYVHVAIDDASRVAYAEVLPDERSETTVAFLARTLAYYRRLGVRVRRLLTDNGANYRSHLFRLAVLHHQLHHRRTRPYTPQTNGKAERFIRTMLYLWAYAQAYRTSAWRTRALPRFLTYYNSMRGHYGIRGLTPSARLAQVL